MTSPRVGVADPGRLTVALVVLAALLIPWHRPPAPRADQLAALGDLPAEQVAKGREFRAALRPGGYAALAVGLLVALALGLTPLGSRLIELVARPFGGHWAAQAVLGGLAVVLVADLVTLPFAAWRQSVLTRYGLSTNGWSGWAVDLLKSYAVSAVIGAVALFGFYAVIRLAPRWWWAFGRAARAAGGAAVVRAAGGGRAGVQPVHPDGAGPLRTELMSMAARDGVPVRDVLVADASRRTKAVNAYVSGLGPTRRVVVYDTAGRGDPGRGDRRRGARVGARQGLRRVAGTLTGAGRRGRCGGALPARLVGAAATAGRCRLVPNRARSRCCWPSSRWPGWLPRRSRTDVAAGGGTGRRARARAHP